MKYSLRHVHHRSISLPLLHLTPQMEGLPWYDLRKILHGGQRMAKVYNGEEILPKGLTTDFPFDLFFSFSFSFAVIF